MTIVSVVKSRDAVVLGTDSMTQVLAQTAPGAPPQFIKGYSNATKLFQLQKYNLGVATYGAGNIGHASMGSIVLDFAETLVTSPSSVKEVAEKMVTFVGKLYDAAFEKIDVAQRPVLGFIVAGYTMGRPLAEVWEVRFPFVPGPDTSQRLLTLREPESFGANWRGIDIPFTRLFFGYDPRMAQQLVALGVKPEELTKLMQQFQSPVMFDSMPIQDTVDFAKHVLRTTISVSTFEVGNPTCGDPLQVACMSRKGFVWVEEPRFHV